MMLFLAAGPCLAIASKFWPRGGAWLCTRLICFWAILPILMVSSPKIYPYAWVILALGLAWRLAQVVERHASTARRWQLLSFPALLGVVAISAGFVFGGDRLKERDERSRRLPPGDSPNVVLIVLDTVRADRLSLYGYERRTSPNLERLARRGIRFDQARATAPWTLPSHASLFTGRLPHELGVQWGTPLENRFTTLAEYLGSRGYATAGFVANTLFCSFDTGLDRGFTHYEDYVLEGLSPFRTAWLVDHALKFASDTSLAAGRTLGIGAVRSFRWDQSFSRFLRWIARKTPSRLIMNF